MTRFALLSDYIHMSPDQRKLVDHLIIDNGAGFDDKVASHINQQMANECEAEDDWTKERPPL